jgi:hypothetical protein
MQGHKAMLGLVIVMGLLILAGTATLIGVVVHRLSQHRPVFATSRQLPVSVPGGAPSQEAIQSEPSGTRITAIARQSDTLLSIALTGGGPDRVLVWDLAAGRRLTEITLPP